MHPRQYRHFSTRKTAALGAQCRNPRALASDVAHTGIVSAAPLSFFGSVPREDFGPESDIDVLIAFAPILGSAFSSSSIFSASSPSSSGVTWTCIRRPALAASCLRMSSIPPKSLCRTARQHLRRPPGWKWPRLGSGSADGRTAESHARDRLVGYAWKWPCGDSLAQDDRYAQRGRA